MCPFYRGWTNRPSAEIGCEGITEESKIRLMFSNIKARDQHMDIFCCNRFHYCELYRAIYQQYLDDD